MLSLPKAAERLDVSAKTVRRLIDRGLLPFARIGRAVKIPAEALSHQNYSGDILTSGGVAGG